MQMIALGDAVLYQNHRAAGCRPYGCSDVARVQCVPFAYKSTQVEIVQYLKAE